MALAKAFRTSSSPASFTKGRTRSTFSASSPLMAAFTTGPSIESQCGGMNQPSLRCARRADEAFPCQRSAVHVREPPPAHRPPGLPHRALPGGWTGLPSSNPALTLARPRGERWCRAAPEGNYHRPGMRIGRPGRYRTPQPLAPQVHGPWGGPVVPASGRLKAVLGPRGGVGCAEGPATRAWRAVRPCPALSNTRTLRVVGAASNAASLRWACRAGRAARAAPERRSRHDRLGHP